MAHAANKSTKRGFTLIELLVVISIIALLISILLPALKSARVAAKQMSCLSNIRQISFAELVYAEDFKGALGYDFTAGSNVFTHHVWSRGGIDPYLNLGGGNTWTTNTGRRESIYFCPDVPDSPDYYRNTGYGSTAYPHIITQYRSYVTPGSPDLDGPALLSQVLSPSKGYFHFEAQPTWNTGGHVDTCAFPVSHFGWSYSWHQGNPSVSFYDGHAGTLTEDEISNPLNASLLNGVFPDGS